MRKAIQPELLEKVARRDNLLRSIQKGNTSKRELENDLNLSRSTIDRSLRQLDERDIIYREGRDYSLTEYGRLTLREYSQFKSKLEAIREAKPLLNGLEFESQLNSELISAANVILPEEPAPIAPERKLEEVLINSQSVLSFTPVLFSRYIEVFDRHVIGKAESVELVLSEDIVECIFETPRKRLDGSLESDTIRFYELSRSPDFCAVIVDESKLWVGVFGENASLKGALVSDEPTAIEWAKQIFRTYRSDSTVISTISAE